MIDLKHSIEMVKKYDCIISINRIPYDEKKHKIKIKHIKDHVKI